MKSLGLKTTGQMRELIANAIKGVMNGDLPIDKAIAIHKLSKNVTDSLYSESKIAMFRHSITQKLDEFGAMQIGDPNTKD